MPIVDAQIIPPTFPPDFCPANAQDFANAFAAGAQINSPLNSGNVILAATAPGVNDRSKLWVINDPTHPFFTWGFLYDSGFWCHRHPNASGQHRWEEFAQESDVWSYDGGDGSNPSVTPPTKSTGAMWQVDHAYDGRSPMSPGPIPSTTNPAVTLSPQQNFGEGQHVLTANEGPPHQHDMQASGTAGATVNVQAATNLQPKTSGAYLTASSLGNAGTGSADAHNTVHPVRGMFCIVRTNRLNYVA